jgi:hypothetical protein
MESIFAYVKRRLMDVPRSEWEPLGIRVCGKKSLPRKLAYERANPPIDTVEPFYRHFVEVDTGAKHLPHESA